MDAISTSSSYLLQPSLQNLHQRTMEWESTIELWKKELAFFKKLISQYGSKLNFRRDIDEKEHFNFLLSYYSGELMSSLTARIHNHEAKLKTLVNNKAKQDEKSYRAEHHAIEHEVRVIEHEFQCYRNELYTLIEKVMTKIKNGQL